MDNISRRFNAHNPICVVYLFAYLSTCRRFSFSILSSLSFYSTETTLPTLSTYHKPMALVERAPSRTDSAFSDVPSFGSDNLESEWFSCSRPPSSLSARNSPFAANPSQQEESEHRSTSSNNNTGRQDLSFTHAANRPAPASSLDTHENLIPLPKLFYPAAHPKPFSFQSPKLGLERRLFARDVHPEHPSLSPSSTSEVVHGPFDINDLFPSATSSLKTCSLVEEFFTLFTVPASVQPFVQKALLWADTSNRRQMATLLEVIQSINANKYVKFPAEFKSRF